MSIAHWLVVVSAFIGVAGASAYIRDTLRGKSKPNRVSWFLWAMSPLIGTAAAISSHADVWATVRIFLAGFLPLLVFLASFLNRKSYWKLTVFDLICGVCSLVALVVWAVVDAPKMAILLAAAGDGFATIPTIRKAWTHPETETGFTYLMGLVGVALIIPSIPSWTIENSAFQIYLLLANTVLAIAVYRKRLFN